MIKTTADDFAKWTRLPPRSIIFGMPDDADLERIIRQAIIKDRPKTPAEDIRFPVNPEVAGTAPYVSKTASYPPMRVNYEPPYVVHRRLGFEEKNAERYGWDLGFVQPLVSTLYFYKDVLLWPNSLASACAYGGYDTDAGKCLPGSPTPYMLYPPGLTITGTVAEGAILTGAAFIFP